jgi:hypothetical protein
MKLTIGRSTLRRLDSKQVDENDEAGGDGRIERVSGSRQHPDRGRTPQRGRGIEPAHAQALAEDQSGAEEPDSRHDLGGDAGRTGFVGKQLLEHDEGRGAERNQGVGPQPRQAIAPLPLEADHRAQAERDGEIESRLLGRHWQYSPHEPPGYWRIVRPDLYWNRSRSAKSGP